MEYTIDRNFPVRQSTKFIIEWFDDADIWTEIDEFNTLEEALRDLKRRQNKYKHNQYRICEFNREWKVIEREIK